MPEAPGAPEPVVAHTLRRAAIEFCEETVVHVIDAPPISVVAGVGEYPINSGDPELDVSMVKFVWFDGRPLTYVPQDVIDMNVADYWPSKTAERPTCFTQQDQDHIIIYPKPSVDLPDALKLRLVVRPSLTSTGVVDWLGKRFIQEISYGALSMLAGMVGKPWSNPEAEAKYRAMFEAAKTRATIDAYRSFTRSPLRVALPRNR